MPELPEVETTIRLIKPHILNRKIEDVWSDAPKLLRNKADVHSFKKEVIGRKIVGLKRVGKNIVFELSGGKMMLIHLKMTGHLLVGKWKITKSKLTRPKTGPLSERVNDYIHLVFTLSDGVMLALSDLRKFAKAIVFGKEQFKNLPDLKNLGPDPLKTDFKTFKKRLTKKQGKIKQVLLDQTVLAGIGNIYTDEILWEANIHPLRKIPSLSEKELGSLYAASKKILKEGVKYQGTSTSDYRKPDGSPGGYTNRRRAYQREGEKCRRDGTFIKRMKIGGRSAHYCSKHQR